MQARDAVAVVGVMLLGGCAAGSPGAGTPPRPPASPSPTATSSAPSHQPSQSGSASPSGTAEPAAFAASVRTIGPALERRMASSWRPGCPVPLTDLRYVTVSYVDFGGRTRTGELVVHRSVAQELVDVFRELYEERFPVRRMRLVDDFGGSDDASMAADNTSAFNCRRSTGSGAWSAHADGRALDINPRENPYVRGSTVLPPAGRAYVDRDQAGPGMIVEGGPVVAAFDRRGWSWGGRFRELKDYQHFSEDGR